MVVRKAQFRNVLGSMPLVTLLPIMTLVRLRQEENAPTPMLVTPSPTVTPIRLVQDWNAHSPMLLTLLGTV